MDYETIAFKDQKTFREWLAKNGTEKNGLWLRMYKKASKIESVTYAQALDEALCFGWIDGQSKSLDDVSFIQKFTPRRQKSMWSKRNIEHIARLSELGLMDKTGFAEVERAKEDGRWDAAYDAPSQMTIPEDFITELKKHPKAEAFFATLNKTNRYIIAFKLQTAKKEETRLRRMQKIIEQLDNSQKLV